MQPPILSINIPTHNRAKYLNELLNQLCGQVDKFALASKLSINIYDNASSDGTQAVCKRHKRLVNYYRNEQNCGADANILQSYALAKTPYVWVLGDDELVTENTLFRILTELRLASPAMIILNDSNYNRLNYFPVVFSDYFSLVNHALMANPHFLIAHSLISLNVVRSNIFNHELARSMLSKSFYPHFIGLIDGVLHSQQTVIVHESKTIIVRRHRAKIHTFDPSKGGHIDDMGASIKSSQVKYLQWLLRRSCVNTNKAATILLNNLDNNPDSLHDFYLMCSADPAETKIKLLRSLGKRIRRLQHFISRIKINTQNGITETPSQFNLDIQ